MPDNTNLSYFTVASRTKNEKNTKELKNMIDGFKETFGEPPAQTKFSIKIEQIPFDGQILHLMLYYNAIENDSLIYARKVLNSPDGNSVFRFQ